MCGGKVPYNKVVFVGNGVPLCPLCAKKYEDSNPKKKGGK